MRITCVICDRDQLSILFFFRLQNNKHWNNSHCNFQLIANWIDIQHVSSVVFFYVVACFFSLFYLFCARLLFLLLFFLSRHQRRYKSSIFYLFNYYIFILYFVRILDLHIKIDCKLRCSFVINVVLITLQSFNLI